MSVAVRNAVAAEVGALARLWHDAWLDAHAALVPEALIRARTRAAFAERLARDLPQVRVAGPVGAPSGLCMVKDDELYQLFVAAGQRRSGVASALASDAEARIRAGGHARAWLACAIGNDRAAAFYRARGWHQAGTFVSRLELGTGTFDLEVWRFEKPL